MENSKLNLELSKIIQTPLKTNQLMSGEYDKKQIVLHHTVSGIFLKMLQVGGIEQNQELPRRF